MERDLLKEAPRLRLAVLARKPLAGCIFHSDRGAQYASAAYRRELKKHGLVGSMSDAGNPRHNARAKSFMKTLKVEEVYLAGYETFDNVVARLTTFIDRIFNERWLHSAIDYRSPIEFESQPAQQAA